MMKGDSVAKSQKSRGKEDRKIQSLDHTAPYECEGSGSIQDKVRTKYEHKKDEDRSETMKAGGKKV